MDKMRVKNVWEQFAVVDHLLLVMMKERLQN